MKAVQSIKERYTDARKDLAKKVGAKNVMNTPQIKKVVVNVGIGRITKESDKVAEVYDAITAISGQKPLKTQAHKSIAGFKIREGQDIGVKVTLRGARMWDFLSRLINGTLPRVRDFQGIVTSSVDSNGHLNIGIKDHTVFPEIVAEKVRYIFGLQVTVVTKSQNREAAEEMFRTLGFPLKKKESETK